MVDIYSHNNKKVLDVTFCVTV